MNAQNTVQDKDLGDRQVQAFFVFMGYAMFLLVIASAANDFYLFLAPTTMLLVAVISIYALAVVGRHGMTEFPRSLLGAVCAWATTIASVTVIFWVSPWSTGISAMRLSIVVGLSTIWATLAFGLLWQYNKLYPPAKPRDLMQFAYRVIAIIASIGYLAIYAILWIFANDLGVIYGRWGMLAAIGTASLYCMYKVRGAYLLRKAMAILSSVVLVGNLILAVFIMSLGFPRNWEIDIAWSVTFIVSLAMISTVAYADEPEKTE